MKPQVSHGKYLSTMGLLKANMTILLLPKVIAKHPHNANDNKKGGYVLLCSLFQDKKMLLPELEVHTGRY